MPSPAHLHAVPADAADLAAERNRVDVLGRVNQLDADAETVTDRLREVGGDLDGSDLVALAERLSGIAQAVNQARRLVDALGHDWCVTHGKRGRADIDGVTYRATTVGSSTSLKVADKARVADTFLRDRLAPWLAEQLGEDPADPAAVSRLWLSLVAEKLAACFTFDPKATALAEQWDLDVSAYATPSTGAGPVPSFAKVPAPAPKGNKT